MDIDKCFNATLRKMTSMETAVAANHVSSGVPAEASSFKMYQQAAAHSSGTAAAAAGLSGMNWPNLYGSSNAAMYSAINTAATAATRPSPYYNSSLHNSMTTCNNSQSTPPAAAAVSSCMGAITPQTNGITSNLHNNNASSTTNNLGSTDIKPSSTTLLGGNNTTSMNLGINASGMQMHSTITQTKKKQAQPTPESLKDSSYWDRRKKNNESAKRSRDTRRMKEETTSLRVVYLEQENLQLRTEVSLLRSEIDKLRCLFYNTADITQQNHKNHLIN